MTSGCGNSSSRWNVERIWQGDVVLLSPWGWPQFSLRYVGYVLWIMSQMSRVVGDAKPAAPFELGTRGLADIQFFGQLEIQWRESNGRISWRS